MEHYHQQQIQHNVAQGCGHEEVEGPPKVADGPQHAGTHVVDDVGHHTQEIDPQIEDGPGQGLLGGAHGPQGPGGEDKARHHKKCADEDAQQHGGVDALVHLVPAAGAEVLGDGHHRSGRQAGEDAHRQVDDDGGGAHGGQGHLAHEPAHHQGVHRIVELLEKGAEPQGEEKGEELFPDHALGDITGGLAQQSHGSSLHILSYR